MITTQVGLRNPSHWLFQHAGAGGRILSWLGCYWLDLLRYLSGQEVAAVGALLGTFGRKAFCGIRSRQPSLTCHFPAGRHSFSVFD